MNCRDWEEKVALYAGGDVAPGVEEHLTGCAGCQELANGLRESLGLLREAHGEAVDEAHLAAVRARVLSKLQRGGRPWWVWAMAAAAVLVVVGVAVRPRPVVVVAPVARVETPVIVPRVENTAPAAGRSARATRARVAPAVAVERGEPLMVKLITDDPDVIIYWISDGKGD